MLRRYFSLAARFYRQAATRQWLRGIVRIVRPADRETISGGRNRSPSLLVNDQP
jgi:hypothetical protein